DALVSLAADHASIAEYPVATDLLGRAELLIANLPDSRDSLYRAQALDVRASIDRAQGRFTDAETELREVVRIRHALGENQPLYVVSLSKLASLYTLMGRYREAAG